MADRQSHKNSNFVDPLEFRQATGRFATGVTVVTTGDKYDIHGMTANSFVSVSLDPPLILVSVANSAKMHSQIQNYRSFGVSVLSEIQVEESKLFAGGGKLNSNLEFGQLSGVPILSESVSVFSCELYQELMCGDHTLFIGIVKDLRYCDQAPLLYFSSSYKTIGDAPSQFSGSALSATSSRQEAGAV